MYNHTTSSQLYYQIPIKSAKTTELSLRNTARKTLDKNAMLALSHNKPKAFFC